MNGDMEKLKLQRIESFKKTINDMIATTQSAYRRSDMKMDRQRQSCYNKRMIHEIVKNGTAEEKANLSEYFFRNNGLYKQFIIHYTTFLTYSWLLVPHLKTLKDKISDRRNSLSYYNASDFCSNFQIERRCTHFTKEVLVKGAYYGLIHDRGETLAIQDLPFEFCRSRFKNHEEIDIVEFNMKFFDTITDETLRKEILKTYPRIVQKGYFAYKYKRANCWIFLPPDMGVYFCFFDEIPFFMDLIPLLDDLEDYKEIDKKRNMLALKRILVQQVGLDGKDLVFEPEEASAMHDGVIEMLRDNPDLDVVTTYNTIDLLDLTGDKDEKTEIDDIQTLVYDSAGISKELFNSSTESGLAASLINDLAMMMILGRKYAHFITTLVNKKFSNKKIKFKFLILPVSYHNSSEYISKAKDLAAFGYSFLIPALATGIDQTNLEDLKLLENELLELDEILKPLQSSYTQSGKAQGSAVETTAPVAEKPVIEDPVETENGGEESGNSPNK